MGKQKQFIDCPKCGKEISFFALLCPHCCERIPQSDFGKVSKEPSSKDASEPVSAQPTSHHWVNIVMLILIMVSIAGVYFRFNQDLFKRMDLDSAYSVSLSRQEFEKICRGGFSQIMKEEGVTMENMNHALEAYARHHGYPNRTALLSTCTKAAYKYLDE